LIDQFTSHKQWVFFPIPSKFSHWAMVTISTLSFPSRANRVQISPNHFGKFLLIFDPPNLFQPLPKNRRRMINTAAEQQQQQLGSPPSAAALLAAALNVANCTSASNSPPELFSLTTSSTSQLANNPFSPGLAQLAAAASPLNHAAAVQHLANAHQLAAALYNSTNSTSIPSPGGSAFAAAARPQPAQADMTAAAAAAMAQLANQQQAGGISQFGPGSPAVAAFAQLEQLARLKAGIAATTVANAVVQQQQQQQPQVCVGGKWPHFCLRKTNKYGIILPNNSLINN
jgi:hypothetical protein